MKRWIRHTAAVATFFLAAAAQAAGIVGSTFPAGFPVIEDTSLAQPVIGFGAAGPVTHTPVILLHGNNDTPFPTACNPYGSIQALAQYLANHGYATSELWGLGYQGDQCDLGVDPTLRSRIAHTNAANVPDLRRFVRAVLAFTSAKQVDIVGTVSASRWRASGCGRTTRSPSYAGWWRSTDPITASSTVRPTRPTTGKRLRLAASRRRATFARKSVRLTLPSCSSSTARVEAARRRGRRACW